MSSGYRWILLAMLSLPLAGLTASGSESTGGGDSAGGGSTIRCQGQARPFLLDRLSLDPKLADRPEVVTGPIAKPAVPSEGQAEMGDTLPSDQAAFQLAIQKLQSWERQLPQAERASKALMGILIKTIQGTAYKRTTHEFNVVPRYKLDPSLRSKCREIKTAILYLPLHGCIISSPVWDSLDLETQAGLVVHEALRQLQGLHLLYDLTDEQIQMITAQIMDGTPSTSSPFLLWMSPKLGRLVFVTAVANADLDSCDRSDGPRVDPMEILMAKIALLAVDDLDSILDKNQAERSKKLVTTGASRDLLDRLLKAGILKR